MGRYADSILGIVCSEGRHMTAEQIFFLLKEKYPGVVMATVYNNLNALTARGKIRKIAVTGFADRYDNMTRHDHLVCVDCGFLRDVDLPDFTETFSVQTGIAIPGYDLKLYFTCSKCEANQDSSGQ